VDDAMLYAIEFVEAHRLEDWVDEGLWRALELIILSIMPPKIGRAQTLRKPKQQMPQHRKPVGQREAVRQVHRASQSIHIPPNRRVYAIALGSGSSGLETDWIESRLAGRIGHSDRDKTII
jgi:hypothetical protein